MKKATDLRQRSVAPVVQSVCRAPMNLLFDLRVAVAGRRRSASSGTVRLSVPAGTVTTLPSWHMLAMTFDGNAIRALVNGSLDVRPPDRPHRTPNFTQCTERWQNPAPISTWTNRSAGTWGPGGAPVSKNKADFTVGGQRGVPCLDGVKCSGMGHAWSGRLGGLAVYDRALEAAELHGLAQQTGMTPLR